MTCSKQVGQCIMAGKVQDGAYILEQLTAPKSEVNRGTVKTFVAK